jgi:hypothetical protein
MKWKIAFGILGVFFCLSVLSNAILLHHQVAGSHTIAFTITPPATTNAQPNEASCTRTTRLPNAPQYDRALSLLAQRIANSNTYSYDQNKFTYFPPQLTNCIKVNESDVTDTEGAEGYFTFNSKEIKPNYYPITADKNYSLTDDVLTALLLSHEMTHVQQYIDQLHGKPSLSCYDKEVEAFKAQLAFYTTLNTEENSSVLDRIQNEKNLNPQLQMLNTMFELHRSVANECNGELFSSCSQKQFLIKLKDVVHQTYKNECSQ